MTVLKWRARFEHAGLAWLEEAAGRGRPAVISQATTERIVAATLRRPPPGVTHWSARLLAQRFGVSHPPCSASGRSTACDPAGRVASSSATTGQVTGRCYERHRRKEFLAFLSVLERRYPTQEIHLVLDNYHTHKHPLVDAWLAERPRFRLHFTPTSASWLNQVEPGSHCCNAVPFNGASSAASPHSSRRSAVSSTAGTTTVTPSPGARHPRRSLRLTVNVFLSHWTSSPSTSPRGVPT